MDNNQESPNFLQKLNMSPAQLWANHKVFLVCFILLIVVIKFQDVIFKTLVDKSNEEVKQAQTQSDGLQKQQDQYNSEANDLVKQAQELGDNKPEVKDDWYKK